MWQKLKRWKLYKVIVDYYSIFNRCRLLIKAERYLPLLAKEFLKHPGYIIFCPDWQLGKISKKNSFYSHSGYVYAYDTQKSIQPWIDLNFPLDVQAYFEADEKIILIGPSGHLVCLCNRQLLTYCRIALTEKEKYLQYYADLNYYIHTKNYNGV